MVVDLPSPKRNPGWPVLAFFARAGAALPILWVVMSPRLQRFYGAHPLHFITCSCFRRRPLLRGARQRDTFLRILDQGAIRVVGTLRLGCRTINCGVKALLFSTVTAHKRL